MGICACLPPRFGDKTEIWAHLHNLPLRLGQYNKFCFGVQLHACHIGLDGGNKTEMLEREKRKKDLDTKWLLTSITSPRPHGELVPYARPHMRINSFFSDLGWQ